MATLSLLMPGFSEDKNVQQELVEEVYNVVQYVVYRPDVQQSGSERPHRQPDLVL